MREAVAPDGRRGWAESGRAVEQVARRLEAGTHPSPDLAERG